MCPGAPLGAGINSVQLSSQKVSAHLCAALLALEGPQQLLKWWLPLLELVIECFEKEDGESPQYLNNTNKINRVCLLLGC